VTTEEKIYNEDYDIISINQPVENLIFVARGSITEKNGHREDLEIPKIKHLRNSIVGLQYLDD